MKTYTITYTGNATAFKKLNATIQAESKRDAVEQFYSSALDHNYFPQEDGSIHDNSGNLIAEAHDSSIEFDGGSFIAEEIK